MKKSIKVLHLVKTCDGAKWVFRLCIELSNLGVKNYIVGPPGKNLLKYSDCAVKFYKINPELNPFSPIESLCKIPKINKIVKEVSPDVVHSHFVTTTLMMRLLLRKSSIPKIFQVAGPLHLENSFTTKLDLISSNKNDYWIATCKWTYNKYKSLGIEESKLGMTYLGVDESDFINKNKFNGKFLKNKYRISKKTKIIGMVSYFYSPKLYLGQTRGLKGHEDLIDALIIVKKNYPDLKCIIVGKSWGKSQKYRNNVIKYARKKDKDLFIFTGFVNNVQEYYNIFDIAVHPSHSENVGVLLSHFIIRFQLLHPMLVVFQMS